MIQALPFFSVQVMNRVCGKSKYSICTNLYANYSVRRDPKFNFITTWTYPIWLFRSNRTPLCTKETCRDSFGRTLANQIFLLGRKPFTPSLFLYGENTAIFSIENVSIVIITVNILEFFPFRKNASQLIAF